MSILKLWLLDRGLLIPLTNNDVFAGINLSRYLGPLLLELYMSFTDKLSDNKR